MSFKRTVTTSHKASVVAGCHPKFAVGLKLWILLRTGPDYIFGVRLRAKAIAMHDPAPPPVRRAIIKIPLGYFSTVGTRAILFISIYEEKWV